MYLLKIPYSMDYRKNFTCTRSFISKIEIDKKYTEKHDIRWVSLDTLKYTISTKSMISLRSIFQTTITNFMNEILEGI